MDDVTAGSGVQLLLDDDVGEQDADQRRGGKDEAVAVSDDFAGFYKSQVTVIYRFLRARTPTNQDAEDLVQTVFFKAFRAWAGFRGDQAARVAWLFRIARNETTSWYRRRWAEPVAIDVIFTDRREVADLEPNPEAKSLLAEEQQALARLVGRLSKDDQELIQLRFAAGLTSVQIAAVLGCSAGAARQRLHRAIDRLREWSDHELR